MPKCEFCDKEYNAEDRTTVIPDPNNKRGGKEKYVNPYCSDEHEEKHNRKKEYEKRKKIRIESGIKKLPRKFRGLESDKEYKHLAEDNLFITGPAGTGKTVLMASIFKHIVKTDEHQVHPAWISYPEFLMKVKRQFSQPEGDPYHTAERIAEAKYPVFIDDIGVEKETEFVEQITYYIINHRESNLLQTCFTSNLSLDEMNDRISSRIAGMCRIVSLSGKDRRINNA